eukprot:Opistho-2@60016
MSALPNPPALIEHKNMKFLIMDAPSDSNLGVYITELKKHKVKDVVRVCDPTYNTERLAREGITVWDWPFGDGEAPPANVINEWLALVQDRFKKDSQECIAIHCVAGLGRAPVLVAVALVEAGLEAEDVVDYIRQRRRGAINSKQLKFLQKYKPHSSNGKGCVIS